MNASYLSPDPARRVWSIGRHDEDILEVSLGRIFTTVDSEQETPYVFAQSTSRFERCRRHKWGQAPPSCTRAPWQRITVCRLETTRGRPDTSLTASAPLIWFLWLSSPSGATQSLEWVSL